MIILPRSDVVIKMAVKAFCKIKKKKKNSTKQACYLYLVFARITEETLWSGEVKDWDWLSRSFLELLGPLPNFYFKTTLGGGIRNANNNEEEEDVCWIVTDELSMVLNILRHFSTSFLPWNASIIIPTFPMRGTEAHKTQVTCQKVCS